MFKKRQNKEVPIYHVLINNFIKYQAFNLTQKQIFKVSFGRKSSASERHIDVIYLCILILF